MPIDPATATAIKMAVKKILTDKETRQKVLVFLMIPLILILVILASPAAILFGTTGETTENEGTPISEYMADLNGELIDKILSEQNDSNMDEVHVIYMGSEGESIDNSGHVLALFSVDTCLASVSEEELTDIEALQEISENMQVANLNGKQKRELKNLYWSMNSIAVEVITIEHTDENHPMYTEPTTTPRPRPSPSPTPTINLDEEMEESPNPTPTHKPTPSPSPTPEPYYIKNIYVTCLSYQDVLVDFDFNEEQLQVLDDFMHGEYAYLFAMVGNNTAQLTPEEIQNIRDSLPHNLSIERENIVLSAYSIVNKVGYFWGGKSYAIGWDSRWGNPTLVTAEGSKTTGTIIPFGLDCSGYTQWVYLNSGFPEDVIKNSFGRSTGKQWQYSLPIDLSYVQIGDLAFKCVPGTSTNHVGIVVGYDEDGDLMIAHCASNNGVVITDYKTTFKFFRRPVILD